MRFRYVAFAPGEGLSRGFVEAGDEAAAALAASRHGRKVLKISQVPAFPTMDQLFPSLYRVSTGEVATFARELATVLGAGINLRRALDMAHKASRKTLMKKTIEDIKKSIDEGGSLSSGLAQHPRIFNPLFVSVVEVGESTGRLAPALDQVADMLMKEHEAKQKAMRTLMYPMAVFGLSMLTLVVLMTTALPALAKVFERQGDSLPFMTRIAVGMGTGVKTHGLKIFVALVLLGITGSFLLKKPGIKHAFDSFKTKVPILGSLIVMGEMARASRTLAVLLESGVTLSSALALVISGSKNSAVRAAFKDAEDSLISGHGLAEALQNHRVLPLIFVELIAIGEETNALKKTMSEAASSYQKSYERKLDGMLAMLEPISTVIVGAIVGFIAFTMFTPIYQGLKNL